MLELTKLSKIYDDQSAVTDVSLRIEPGEFVTMLGPSGCGKTTLLRMLAGLVQPSSGSIVLEGRDITLLPPYKRDLNMVFQQYALFPHLTVEDNILFGLRMKKVPAEEQRKRLLQVVELTRLTGLERRKPHQLSGGQQQRVAVARAIVNRPKVLLLDEPLAALDLQLRKNLQHELKQLQKRLGITFIYVTHDQEEAMTLSDRIVVMNGGVCEQVGAPRDIYAHPASLFVASFIGENNTLQEQGRTYAVRPDKVKLVPLRDKPHPEGHRTGMIEDMADTGSLLKLYVRPDGGGPNLLVYRYGDEVQGWRTGQKVAYGWASRDEVVLAR
ncbi:ABC transporter ATP-binding protein [Paenibacillus allorhizosphaerae]|uniref:Spermidine/putrescine import ATP-binding protein PotA n=1 Tax=Paenibacillus allorhizosphaerae TaxID=2849866 RepID=A0ABN7TRR8_9BACL|nr:ABC transporter ATP-binding protein [Paenibacillus allorhizosphaerae]CAG7645214.1 Spermidine/putrescine import ATP-binding protein PotA [Paenibacillus allorhizosphaerae]